MNWEETIRYIRSQSEYSDLIKYAYLEEDLSLNLERYRQSGEFWEILRIFKQYSPKAHKILDVGCGNGTTSIALALEGYEVTAVEPDKSDTVGTAAIQRLSEQYNVNNIAIIGSVLENVSLPNESFDIVFIRQAMHHANDLEIFISKAATLLKQGGLLLTIRDHVIFDEEDKEWFLVNHPLHKFYGGENAYRPDEYKMAIIKSGLTLIKEIKYYESVINYYPQEDPQKQYEIWKKSKKERWGNILANDCVLFFYSRIKGIFPLNEKRVPGRLYSYIAIKK